VFLELEEVVLNTKEACLQQVLVLVVLMEEEEAVVFTAVLRVAISEAMLEEAQVVLAILAAAFPRPQLLLQQAHQVLLMAKPLPLICSTPRTSKALG